MFIAKWFNRFGRGVGLLFFLVLFYSFGRSLVRTHRVESKLHQAREALNQAEVEKKELENALSSVRTQYYTEMEARNKLGLAYEGEIVLVLPSDEVLKKLSPRVNYEKSKLPDPNWLKWMKLFI